MQPPLPREKHASNFDPRITTLAFHTWTAEAALCLSWLAALVASESIESLMNLDWEAMCIDEMERL